MTARPIGWMTWTGVIVLGIYGVTWAADPLAASVGIFDTGTSAAAPLSGQAIAAKAGWTQVPEDKTAHKFKGDAVLANDRLTAVFRQGGPGVELYVGGAQGPVLRTVLAPMTDKAAARLASVAVAKNAAGEAALDAAFKSPGGKDATVRFELQPGQVFIRTEARGGAGRLRVEAPCRFAVLPDFFADDIAVDAAELPAARAELPSENFLLHLV
ncbi:MAG: hypothetical protein NTU94_09340, partial [Planctomycetota bacterium]|nr:hypothetical protein [Planctomycetota bacterium]